MLGKAIGATAALITIMLIASPASAQDCGEDCDPCAKGWNEGTNYNPNGAHFMDCLATETGNCDECDEGLASHHTLDAATIAQAVDAADSSAEVAAAVEAYGGRLLLNARRGLVVVLGSACNPSALTEMVYVTTAKAKEFRESGVRALAEFLESEAGAPIDQLVSRRR